MPPAKKQKASSSDQYVEIDGDKYDKKIIDEAERLKAEKPKGSKKLTLEDAEALWECAKDGPGVTEIERESLRYVYNEYAMTGEAQEFLGGKCEHAEKSKVYHGKVDGVKVDQDLWNFIERRGNDDKIDKTDAEAIWKEALDGNKVTKTEQATIELMLTKYASKVTAGAKTYLEEKLASC